MEAQTENPLAELTDAELRDAYDHAVGNSMRKPASDEYRQWWSARANYFLRELERRDSA